MKYSVEWYDNGWHVYSQCGSFEYAQRDLTILERNRRGDDGADQIRIALVLIEGGRNEN